MKNENNKILGFAISLVIILSLASCGSSSGGNGGGKGDGGGTITSIALPDTGQIGNYTATFGEDSDYTINPMSYTDNGNGTVTDNVTGLMWQQEDDDTNRTYQQALTYCVGLSLGGYADWRMPTKKELHRIVLYNGDIPSIDSTYFPNTNASPYWTSTVSAVDSSSAWIVDFYYNRPFYYDKTDGFKVRCVRGRAVPSQSFVDNGNGTVTDKVTGLIWQKEDDNIRKTWEEALAYCEGMELAGSSDWRLPNTKELDSIADETVYNPAIDTSVFPGTDASGYSDPPTSGYWSSTSYFADGAWSLDFYDGVVAGYLKADSYFVRCVR